MKQKKLKKLKKDWSVALDSLREKDLIFVYREVFSDTLVLFAFIEGMPYHVGYVTFRSVSRNTIEVLGSYVLPWARRESVRSNLNKELIRGYPETVRILTGECSGKASKKWMKSQGYVHNETGWELKLSPGRKDDATS